MWRRHLRRWWTWRGSTWRKGGWKRPGARTLSSAWASRDTWLSCDSARARWGTPTPSRRPPTAPWTFTRPPSCDATTAALWTPALSFVKGISRTACTKVSIYTPETTEINLLAIDIVHLLWNLIVSWSFVCNFGTVMCNCCSFMSRASYRTATEQVWS